MMPSGEAHLMCSAHLQVALKVKCLQLPMGFYSYGDGASQKRVNWRWCTTRVVDLRGEETKENKSFGKQRQMMHKTLATTI